MFYKRIEESLQEWKTAKNLKLSALVSCPAMLSVYLVLSGLMTLAVISVTIAVAGYYIYNSFNASKLNAEIRRIIDEAKFEIDLTKSFIEDFIGDKTKLVNLDLDCCSLKELIDHNCTQEHVCMGDRKSVDLYDLVRENAGKLTKMRKELESSDLRNNPLMKMMADGIIRDNSVRSLIDPRGSVFEADSALVKNQTPVGYYEGLSDTSDSDKET